MSPIEPIPDPPDESVEAPVAPRPAAEAFALRALGRASGGLARTSAWSESVRTSHQPRRRGEVVTVAASSALDLAGRLGSPRVVRDAAAWGRAVVPEEPVGPMAVHRPVLAVAPPSPRPAAGEQAGGDLGTDHAARRFHRSFRRAEIPLADPERVEARLWDRLDRSSPRPVGHATAEGLAAPLGPGAQPGPAASAARIHDDATADDLARRHGADAVTRGNRVAFRIGSFRPETPRGLALLGHELTHASRPDLPSGGDVARRDEEHLALDVERRLLRNEAAPASAAPPGGRLAHPPSAPAPVGGPATATRAAANDRPLGDANPAPSAPGPLSESQIRDLKEQIYRDLVRKIRIEHERGG